MILLGVRYGRIRRRPYGHTSPKSITKPSDTNNLSNVRTDRRTNGPTCGRTDRPMDGWTDVRTHGLIDLPRYDSMAKETHGIEYFCRCPSTGLNSQSEGSDFGNRPITAEISLATSGEIENLPLEVTNCDLPKIEKKSRCAHLSGNMNGVLLV